MEKSMTVFKERKVSGIPGDSYSAARTTGYFQLLFGMPDTGRYGWSPLHLYSSGVELFRQNDSAKQVYFIEKGIVKISCIGPGGEERIISLRRSNWLLGATQVISGNTYMTTATTLTPCSIRCVAARLFMDQLTTDNAFSVEVNRMLSFEIGHNIRKIITLECMSATERLKNFLCELITYEDLAGLKAKGQLELPLKSAELAEIIAVTPQHLYRILRNPELKVHLKQSKKILSVIDPLGFLHKQLS
jgi:CRP-like cAMP-binding protein